MIPKKQFAGVMAYLATAIQKPVGKETIDVYYDLLGDLPVEVLQAAAKRVVLEHKWATFPSVAELREAASETMRGQVKDVSPAEAWEMAWAVACRHDPNQSGEYVSNGKKFPSQWAAITAGMPQIVLDAINAFGPRALIYGQEPIGVLRGQFLKTFEQIAARHKRQALLPQSLRKEIEGRGKLPAPVKHAIADLGKEPA
jgi:hypothetical protein